MVASVPDDSPSAPSVRRAARAQLHSASKVSLSVGAPKLVPFGPVRGTHRAQHRRVRVARGSSAPRSPRSRCTRCRRCPRCGSPWRWSMKGGTPPTEPYARTGLLTPPGIERLRARVEAPRLSRTTARLSSLGSSSSLAGRLRVRRRSAPALGRFRRRRVATPSVAARPGEPRRLRPAARSRRGSRPRERFMTRTPWVLRPITEMPLAGQRSTLPPSVMSMSSIFVDHLRDTHHRPFRLVVLMLMIPEPTAPLEPVLVERRALAVAVLVTVRIVAPAVEDLHPDHLVVARERDAADTPVAVRPIGAHVALVEADRLAALAGEDHLVLAAAAAPGTDQLVAVAEVDRDDAGAARIRVGGQRRLLDDALAGAAG